jgi:transcriptional regulator GlxA family with amidase domain
MGFGLIKLWVDKHKPDVIRQQILTQEQLEMSPSAYLNELRLVEASQILRHRPELSISAVAYEVGFTSAPHFNRLFRARFGTSPSQWRSEE